MRELDCRVGGGRGRGLGGEGLGSRMGTLDGRVAIVTGAGRGIGRSVASLLASEGAAVAVNDIGAALDGSGSDAGPAQQAVDEITPAGGRAVASDADISDHAAAEALVKPAITPFGRAAVPAHAAWPGPGPPTSGPRTTWVRWSPTSRASGRAGSTAASCTRPATRYRCTATRSR